MTAQDFATICASTASPITQTCFGVLVAFTEDGVPLVSFAQNTSDEAQPCRFATPLTRAALGRNVLLMPDPVTGAPVITGVVHDRIEAAPAVQADSTYKMVVDGEELTIVATKKLSLVCGKASVTLDCEGIVDIRGMDISSRAARQNRLKGASVSVN